VNAPSIPAHVLMQTTLDLYQNLHKILVTNTIGGEYAFVRGEALASLNRARTVIYGRSVHSAAQQLVEVLGDGTADHLTVADALDDLRAALREADKKAA
jgi:hypothetical protein